MWVYFNFVIYFSFYIMVNKKVLNIHIYNIYIWKKKLKTNGLLFLDAYFYFVFNL